MIHHNKQILIIGGYGSTGSVIATQLIHYVDISASYPVLSRIEALNDTARESGATAVLSVGLAPGLTNLLAGHCHSKVPDMTAADIYVLLGLGEAHGEAAIRWTLENLDAIYSVLENGKTKQVKSFQDSKKTVFPDGIGKRTTYRFDFRREEISIDTSNGYQFERLK